MSRGYNFSSTARAIVRAAAQAERAKQAAIRREEAAAVRAYKMAERQAKADEKEASRQYLISRAEEAEEQTAAVQEAEAGISSLLLRALDHRTTFEFDEMYEAYLPKVFDEIAWKATEPSLADFLPRRPGILIRLLSKKYAAKVKEAEIKHNESVAEHSNDLQIAKSAFAENEELERQRVDEVNEGVRELKQAFAFGEHDAVVIYTKSLLSKSLLEEIDALSAEVGYSNDSRHLVVDLELPDVSVVPEESSFKYIKNSDRIDPVIRNPAKRRTLYGNLICQVALKSINTIFQNTTLPALVDCLTLNGMLDAVDPATGQDIRVCLLSVRITQDDFKRLNLRNVQPEQCLKVLKASVSRSPAELVPVRPIVELDMVDPRFIASADVLSTIDNRPNLMELSPSEFESLITNLFSKMGLDTRQTQASRDGGVDCVAFDQRPVFGGKVVIQAKRYKNLVGVSAVRDLFGTVLNEGASKGILVTTSGYGKASFEFAKDKPLELLDGSNLLHLLAEHANVEAKIVAPDDWRDLCLSGE